MKKRCKRNQRGGAVFEFTLVVPLFALLFLGIIDFSRAMLAYSALTHASEAAARYAAVRSRTSTTPATASTIKSRALQASTGLERDKLDVVATWRPANVRGGVVRVAMSYSFEPITPFVPRDRINLMGSAEMRISN